jgi:hypothetical protein
MTAVYLWNDSYWCEGDIVPYLTDHEPYSAWKEHNEPGTDTTENELDDIARRFHVNRNNPSSVRRRNFPVLLDSPPDPPACCRGCLAFFTLPPDGPSVSSTERNVPVTTNMQSALTRHALAMLHPEGPHEQTLSHLFSELSRLSDRYKNDVVMVAAVEKLGSAIITLLNGEVGRIDQGALDKQVRDVVRGAGGDDNNL